MYNKTHQIKFIDGILSYNIPRYLSALFSCSNILLNHKPLDRFMLGEGELSTYNVGDSHYVIFKDGVFESGEVINMKYFTQGKETQKTCGFCSENCGNSWCPVNKDE